MYDPSIEITSIDELNQQILLLSYTKKKDWIEEHESSNVGMYFIFIVNFI